MTVVICLDEGGGMTFFSRRQSTDCELERRIDILSPDALFVQSEDAIPELSRVDRFIVYRWNRKYPRDGAIKLNLFDAGFRLSSICDFRGSSHDRITEEIWERTVDI